LKRCCRYARLSRGTATIAGAVPGPATLILGNADLAKPIPDELVYRNAFGKYRRALMRRGNAFALARFCFT